jgi:hypothetical protein
MIYQAVTKEVISPSTDTNKTRIIKAVKKQFKNYPVKAKK